MDNNNKHSVLSVKDGVTLLHVEEASKCAERAFWWMKRIDTKEVESLNVLSKVQDVLALLQQVDNITMDIMVTIRNK